MIRIQDKNPGKTIEQIREGLNAKPMTAVPLTIDELEANAEEMMQIAEETRIMADALQEQGRQIENIQPASLASLGLEHVPAGIPFEQWPNIQNKVLDEFANRAFSVDTKYQELENVAGVFTPTYDIQKPFFSITLSAAGTLQLSELHNEADAYLEVLVKRTAGTEALTFLDGAKVLALSAGAPSTTAGSYTRYLVEKIGTLFFVTAYPLGLPTTQENVVEKLAKITGLHLEQLPTVNGVIKVKFRYDKSAVPDVDYKISRSTRPTLGLATLKQNKVYDVNGFIDDGVIGKSTPLQGGQIYYYHITQAKSGYSTSAPATISIVVN